MKLDDLFLFICSLNFTVCAIPKQTMMSMGPPSADITPCSVPCPNLSTRVLTEWKSVYK